MNYEEEIEYRRELLSIVRNGGKLLPEERLWLATHRIINRMLGYPYINTDIVQLQPNVNYVVCVKVEKLTYSDRIIPVITVPGGKGTIVTNGYLADYNGNAVSKKMVKMLGVLVDAKHNEVEFAYQSNLGLIGISYECDYFDERQKLIIRKNSCVGDPGYAMLSESLANNKIRYRCKNPVNDSFEEFVFTLEYNIAHKTG